MANAVIEGRQGESFEQVLSENVEENLEATNEVTEPVTMEEVVANSEEE